MVSEHGATCGEAREIKVLNFEAEIFRRKCRQLDCCSIERLLYTKTIRRDVFCSLKTARRGEEIARKYVLENFLRLRSLLFFFLGNPNPKVFFTAPDVCGRCDSTVLFSGRVVPL